MKTLFSWTHNMLVFAERGFVRVLMMAVGFVLVILGLGLGVSMVMLPAGLFLGLLGVGLVVWATVGDVPINR